MVSVALTTYNDIVVTTDSFNATQTLWYHRFTFGGPPKPGTQCTTYNLTVGQPFTTSTKILTYTLLTINGDKTIFPYAGVPLESCDVISAAVDVDPIATTVNNVVHVACNATGLQITAKTEYVWSLLPSLQDLSYLSPAEEFFEPMSDGNRRPREFVQLGYVGLLILLLVFPDIYYDRLATTSSNLIALVRAAVGSENAPERISMQGLPSCSQLPMWSNYVSTYCNHSDVAPVTWLYGGGLAC